LPLDAGSPAPALIQRNDPAKRTGPARRRAPFREASEIMNAIARMVLVIAVALAGGVSATVPAAGPARAQAPDSATKGLAVARRWCARCHVVEAGQTAHALDAAPPFAEIARDTRMTASRLRGFLSDPHGRMPTGALSRDDLADLIAYIESLRKN
jgi:mono/diheme cytochrome c family protein